MDRIRLVYPVQGGSETELPFKILVLGDFSLRKTDDIPQDLSPVRIDKKNFDLVLKAMNISLCFDLKNYLFSSSAHLKIDISISSFDDLTPDAIVSAVPEMKQMANLIKIIQNYKKNQVKNLNLSDLNEFQKKFIVNLRKSFDKSVPYELFDIIIAETQHCLSCQLDALLHHESFKTIESIWRSLYFLVSQVVDKENCIINILDIRKQDIYNDFEFWKDIFNTFLYKKVYTEELGQFGGKPYGVIISDYDFGPSADDIWLLKELGKIAGICYAPFIAGAHPSFFCIENIAELPGLMGMTESFDIGIQYVKWRAFRQTEEARYIGLTLPKFLLRQPYDFRTHNIDSFAYIESNYSLWGNASFAFGACMIRSFIKHRWCLNIVGPQDGQVPGLKWKYNNALAKNQQIIPTQILIPEKKETELALSGFIPLTIHKSKDYAAFYSANSVKNPKKDDQKTANINQKLHVQLPYTLIISRLAHYIKVIQRDNIGSTKSRQQIEKELNSWLVQYVSDMDNPSSGVRARRPLRKAHIKVERKKDEHQKIWYQMRLNIMPHLKYMGADFSLLLEGQLD